MRKKAKLLAALAFSMAVVPISEVAAIAVADHHDVAMSTIHKRQHSSTAEIAVMQNHFSASSQAAHARSELIMVNSTPVWVSIN
jgi:hypothetical protein